MKFLVLVVLLLGLPAGAWGTERLATVSCTITPADSGCGWKWADGDTLVIADGATVTIPYGRTVIAGPDDGAAVAVRNSSAAGTGILKVNGTLQLKGNVQQANAAWVVNADGVSSQGRIEHAGATAHYTWQIGMANNQKNARLLLAGTGPHGGRVVVTNVAGAARFGGFHQGNVTRQSSTGTMAVPVDGTAILGGGNIVATWTTFQDLGYEISANVWQDWLTASQYYDYNETSLDHCLVINCTMLRTVNAGTVSGAGAVFRITNTSFLSPLSFYSIYPQHLTAKSAAGVRLVKDSVVEGVVVGSGFDYTFENTVFAGKKMTGGAPMVSTGGRIFKINSMSDILAWNRITDNSTAVTTTNLPYGGLIQRLLSIRAEGIDNDHFRMNAYPYTESVTTVDGAVVERCPGAHSNGAAFVAYTNKGATITLSNILDVPTIDYYGSFRPSTLSMLALVITSESSTLSVTLKNVTRYAANTWFFTDFESTPGNPGVLAGLYNNLLWTNSSVSRQTWCADVNAVAADNSITAAGYNATFNVNEGGYSTLTQSSAVPPSAYASPPGTGDFSADPQFVDSTRNLLAWAQQFKPAITTYDEILKEFLKRNDDDGFDPRFDFREYYHWVRAGFTPQNLGDFAASGKDGLHVGAVAPLAAVTPAYPLTVAVIGSGTVAASPDTLVWSGFTGAGSYNSGVQVILKPAPAAGTVFKGWSGACVGLGDSANGNACTVTMTAAVNLTATFAAVNQPPAVSLTTPVTGAVYKAPAAITLTAAAADADGTIARVDFYSGTTLLGSSTATPYTCVWTPAAAGTYLLTAVATDNSGAAATSAEVAVTISDGSRINVALAGNGGVATASSAVNSFYPATAVTNGDRKGANMGAGGVWRDGTNNVWPDWIQVRFSGQKSITEVHVFTIQDNYTSPVEPTAAMSNSKFGVTAFDVQYWNGTSWVTVPGGSITGNNLVWRKIVFPAVTTDRVRVVVNAARTANSMLTEIEAY